MMPEISQIEALGPLVTVAPVEPYETKGEISGFLFSDNRYYKWIPSEKLQTGAKAFLEDSSRIFVFREAKPVLRVFLRLGIDLQSPVCLKALAILAGTEKLNNNERLGSREEAVSFATQNLLTFAELLGKLEGTAKLSRLENRVIRVFASMEEKGLYFDAKAWGLEIEVARKRLEAKKYEALLLLGVSEKVNLLGESQFNLDSGKEVKNALEKVLGQPLFDTQRSTLARINHPAAIAVLKYRETAKLVKTYGDPFLLHVDSETSRIHATFETIASASGRVACLEPNLQNLPSSEAFHRCVKAPPGKKLITADYAGCELRILASFSKDEVFLEAFSKDQDLHSEVASKMFNKKVDKEHFPELRQKAKAINFGLMYGMGPRALARTLSVSLPEAEVLFLTYFKTYPQVKSYLDQCVKRAFCDGYVQTALGRKLCFAKEELTQFDDSGDVSRLAKNMPIQGTGAEIVKLAMIRIHEKLQDNFKEAFLVNMIHDELVVECLEEDETAVLQTVKHEMELAQSQILPFVKPKAEVHAGDYWKH